MIRSKRRYKWIQLLQLQCYCLLQCLQLYLLLIPRPLVTNNSFIKITLRSNQKNRRKFEGIQYIPIGYNTKSRHQYPAKIGHLYLIHFKCDNYSFLFILIYLQLFILCFLLFFRGIKSAWTHILYTKYPYIHTIKGIICMIIHITKELKYRWMGIYKIKDYYDGHNGGFKYPIIHYPPLLSTLNQ